MRFILAREHKTGGKLSLDASGKTLLKAGVLE
jgi:hypothetical protein